MLRVHIASHTNMEADIHIHIYIHRVATSLGFYAHPGGCSNSEITAIKLF